MLAEEMKKIADRATLGSVSTAEGESKLLHLLDRIKNSAEKGEYYLSTTILARLYFEVSFRLKLLGFETSGYFLDETNEVKGLTISWK